MDREEINQRVIQQFRAGGEVTGMHRDRLLLLTTTGRTTGEPRTAPMMFLRLDGEDGVLVIASANAAPADPDWYLNLEQEPHVRVEEPDDTYEAVARALADDQRDRVWPRIVEDAPFLAEHQAKIERRIPVVRITHA